MDFSIYPGYEEYINSNNNPMPNQSPQQNNNNPPIQPINKLPSITPHPDPPPIQQAPPNQENNTQSIINKILTNDSISNRQLNTNLLNNQNYNKNKPMVNNPIINKESEKGNKFSVKLLVLGLIIALSVGCSLAWNEVARYYIGRSIKFYNGKPIYYIYYSLGISVLTLLVYLYCASYM